MINTKPEAMEMVGFCKHKLQNKHQWQSAWVSHDEESTAKMGRTLSYEIRLLEKIKTSGN
jgi:hypothetical protein